MQAIKISFIKVLYLNSFLLSIVTPRPVGHFYAICTEVVDGDTVIIEGRERLRLAHIDAPELEQQSFNGEKIGEGSKKYLEHLILGKRIKVSIIGKGYYGRVLGNIYFEGKNINQKLVKDGYAVIYDREFEREELIARREKRGIWRTSGFYYPKAHRRKNKITR